jgi:subtilisin family serine protease
VALAALLGALLVQSASAATQERGRYIVVLKDSIERPAAVAETQVERRNGKLGFVYRHALRGYSAILPTSVVKGLEGDSRVRDVRPDHPVTIAAQLTPTGIDRIFATGNANLDIDGEDNARTDADVAVIDTGIDYEHPDLDVVARTNCIPVGGGEVAGECINNSGTDGNSHGTHVAGTVGAIDNGEGVVGAAPGARLWAVKVLGTGGSGYESWITAGVEWVTAHAGNIEVANMSIGCLNLPCSLPTMGEAISDSVAAGVVYVVAAGNNAGDAKFSTFGTNPDVITVSALADYDGKPGGEAEPSCIERGQDDTLASFSNFGADVEVAAPGVCILSTFPGGEYEENWGTSMASPHVAGAAAILASQANPNDKADVEAIRETIEEEGNSGWTDTSGDGIQEPLLDLSDENVFTILQPPELGPAYAVSVTPQSAILAATVNPKGRSTEYHFEYGTTTAYGSSAPLPPEDLGSGTAPVEVSEKIEGLAPATTYHFRVVASNSEGTSYGEDETFTTTTSATFEAEKSPVKPVGTTTEWLELHTDIGSVSCQSWPLQGKAQETGGSLTLAAATYVPCEFFGQEVNLYTNGCEFRFNAGDPVEGPPEYSEIVGSMDIVNCKSPMKFITTGCSLEIPSQTGIGPVVYQNVGSGSEREVSVRLEATNVEYAHSGGSCGKGSSTEGFYFGSWMLRGETAEGGKPNGLWIE